jgi:hypothetical protein
MQAIKGPVSVVMHRPGPLFDWTCFAFWRRRGRAPRQIAPGWRYKPGRLDAEGTAGEQTAGEPLGTTGGERHAARPLTTAGRAQGDCPERAGKANGALIIRRSWVRVPAAPLCSDASNVLVTCGNASTIAILAWLQIAMECNCMRPEAVICGSLCPIRAQVQDR